MSVEDYLEGERTSDVRHEPGGPRDRLEITLATLYDGAPFAT